MFAERKINWAFLSQALWSGFSASILFLGWGSCFADERCAGAEWVFLPFMLLLSFPAGPVAMLLMYLVVEGGTPVSFTLLWTSVFIAGFVQWSMITANVGHPKVISLGLEKPGDSELSSNHDPSLPTSRPMLKRKRERLTRHHDNQGRTPLERALGKEMARR
jgi:hypothetical protein